ncbi:MAG: M15 family metallopeptidase [Planctomycetes bacterium]|nr:M15 family metallopeptidase [Planctomycetota bacterium]
MTRGCRASLAGLQHSFAASPISDVGNFLEQRDPQAWRQCRVTLSIEDCGEPLVEISPDVSFTSPHPYAAAGAPYGEQGPWFLRVTVAQRLQAAQARLSKQHPGFQLRLFDAYRPLSVQGFMIEHEWERIASEQHGGSFKRLDPIAQDEIRSLVETFWAPASQDTTSPPPHSTGAALDLTIVDPHKRPLDMGTEIDELSERSAPSFFAAVRGEKERHYHANRTLLYDVMTHAGFHRLPSEWWHFSYGDQTWALIENLADPESARPAIYGRV